MVQTWKIGIKSVEEIHFEDETSLDAVSRHLPDGYYSTFRTYNSCTRVIGLSAHLKRLPGLNGSSLREPLIRLLAPFHATEARARITQTYEGQIYISIEPLQRLPAWVYEKGGRVVTTSVCRDDPRIKSTAFISQSERERKHIAKEGVFEALLVKNGRIFEGMTSNFFYIIRPEWCEARPQGAQKGILYTAQRDILLGVTRRAVIRAAQGSGVQVRYKGCKLNQLPALSEAFITSSSRGIVPVVQIDDVRVGQGKVGAVTRQLIRAYEAYVTQKAETI